MFINPVPGEVAAAELIDRLGLRGTRIGGAWVSDKHANFIQASDGARAADVRAVMELVRRRVAEATGIVLRSEVRLIGFADVEPIERGRRPMTGRDLPDQPVPDKVLEELLAAFGTAEPNGGADCRGRLLRLRRSVDRPDPRRRPEQPDERPPRRARRAAAEPGARAGAAAREPGAADRAHRRAGQRATTRRRRPHRRGGGRRSASARPTPTGSTRREARAAARTDAKAVKIATREAAKSAKATSKATAKASKEAAKEAKKAAKRGDARAAHRRARAARPGAVADRPAHAEAGRRARGARAGVRRRPGGPSGGRRTIVIADDDQPGDTLYLADDAEQRLRDVHASGAGSGGRSTIVIDDGDQRIDAVATQVASPNVDPRLRARRLAVHRAAGRRRLLWAGIIAGVVLLAVAIVAVLASSIFDARDIEVQGNQYTDPALVEQVLDELRGKPILLVDTQKLERELESSPWIESARVSTDFPHHVLIDIRERKPRGHLRRLRRHVPGDRPRRAGARRARWPARSTTCCSPAPRPTATPGSSPARRTPLPRSWRSPCPTRSARSPRRSAWTRPPTS